MADEESERETLLPPTNTSDQPTRRWGLGCLTLAFFLQGVIVNGLNVNFRDDFKLIQGYKPHISLSILVILDLAVYAFATFTGLYADLIVGKYRALIFGLSLQTTGSFIGLCAVLKIEAAPDMEAATLKLLVAVLSVHGVLIAVGVLFTVPLFLSFGATQVKQTPESISIFVRWASLTFMVGCFAEDNADMIPKSIIYSQYYTTVVHAVILALSGLSLALVLLGMGSYKTETTSEGKKSFKEFMATVRVYIVCLRCPRRYDETQQQSVSNMEDMDTRRLRRLNFRRGVLAVALLSAVAALVVMQFASNGLISYFPRRCKGGKQGLWCRLIKFAKYLGTLSLVLGVECIKKIRGRHLWQENVANRLKTAGVAFVLTAAAMLTAGIASSHIISSGHQSENFPVALPFIPSLFLLGLAEFMASTSIISLCITESSTGLSTTGLSFGISLALIVLPLSDIRYHKTIKYRQPDVFFYILAGCAIAVLAFVYIPVSKLYMRADAAVNAHHRQREDPTTMDDRNTAVSSSPQI